ncbi:MAG: 50S ribosomal protein L33 [Bacilli bacterium]|jgi:large subunit ribosomal protein L33|nr:50S ribosomal protein L33 [Bacilli bacterium]MDD2681701.1 50S ribosomal protein L33 [Bacilli bacterium]MDD3121548.1 50S ribosomal protein L33 [Bacilli bacterium]MDD4062819.1 50S ribosomal protein L33 [Bacilli bacterium]MDD4482226.1 50S ribosomal protein L33 [Bacilli bacterium]
MREKAILICEECLSRNYIVSKNKTNNPDRLVIKKFCKKCNKHTIHKETK